MKNEFGEMMSNLMECGICWEIVHPNCLKKKHENLESDGIINEDLPNSWKCPKCCCDGKEGQLKVNSGMWLLLMLLVFLHSGFYILKFIRTFPLEKLFPFACRL